VQAGVDYVHTGIAQSSRHDTYAAVVAIETDFRYEHADGFAHGFSPQSFVNRRPHSADETYLRPYGVPSTTVKLGCEVCERSRADHRGASLLSHYSWLVARARRSPPSKTSEFDEEKNCEQKKSGDSKYLENDAIRNWELRQMHDGFDQ